MSTSFIDAEAAIRARLIANWGSTTDLIQYDNQKVDPTPGTPYVEFKVLFDLNEQASIGGGDANNLHRLTGLIYFSIVVPANSGTKALREIMDSITTIFKNKTFSSILTFEIIAGAELTEASGNWYMKTVSIPFHFDYN